MEFWNDLDGVSKAYTDWKINEEFQNRIQLQSNYILSAYDTTTQTNAGATVANIFAYNTIDIQNEIEIINGTDIFFNNAGVYNIQFSAQVDKTDAGNDEVEIWLEKNGTNVSNSATIIELVGNNAEAVCAWNWFVDAEASDFYRIMWHSDDTDVRLLARGTQSNPDRPEIPSIILTVSQVSPVWKKIY